MCADAVNRSRTASAAAWLRPVATAGRSLMPLPQTEMPGRFEAHFAERGIRMTQPRRAILRLMETAIKPWMPPSSCARPRSWMPAWIAARSTPTLQLLKRPRKLNRNHIHMAGWRSGIMEFVSDIFETFKGQVEEDGCFRIVMSRLEIGGGYCAACCK